MKTALEKLAEKIENRLHSGELYTGGIQSSLSRDLKYSAKQELEWILDEIEKILQVTMSNQTRLR